MTPFSPLTKVEVYTRDESAGCCNSNDDDDDDDGDETPAGYKRKLFAFVWLA